MCVIHIPAVASRPLKGWRPQSPASGVKREECVCEGRGEGELTRLELGEGDEGQDLTKTVLQGEGVTWCLAKHGYCLLSFASHTLPWLFHNRSLKVVLALQRYQVMLFISLEILPSSACFIHLLSFLRFLSKLTSPFFKTAGAKAVPDEADVGYHECTPERFVCVRTVCRVEFSSSHREPSAPITNTRSSLAGLSTTQPLGITRDSSYHLIPAKGRDIRE